MYMCYDKLWQLLAANKLSKADLCRLTGMSSRTMAKLSKNESVTTDTLLRICEALNCELCDISELKTNNEPGTIYEAYKLSAKKTVEGELTNVSEFEFHGVSFTVHVLKKAVNKKTVIHCSPGGSVTEERIYPVGLYPAKETSGIFHSSQIVKGRVTVLIITGNPGIITGLDNGCVHSAKYGCVEEGFYVMSMSAFKIFEMRQAVSSRS